MSVHVNSSVFGFWVRNYVHALKIMGAASGFANAWPLGTVGWGEWAQLNWTDALCIKKIEHPTGNFDSWPWTENTGIFFHFNWILHTWSRMNSLPNMQLPILAQNHCLLVFICMAKCACHLLSILTKSNVKRRITINPNTNTTANTPKSLTEKCEGNILRHSVFDFVPGRIFQVAPREN